MNNEIEQIIKKQEAQYNQAKQIGDTNLDRIISLKEFAEDTPQYISELNRTFEEKTSLNFNEISILFVCIGLQLIRQHYLTEFATRGNDQEKAQNTFGHTEEHSNRHHRYYNPSLQEILSNPVPFDANIGANGALAGGGKLGHRATTLGHDPLLGLIFGTSNIATSTITTKDFISYHIRTSDKYNKDTFAEHASTQLVLSKTANKLTEGTEGIAKVGASFLKEIIHLRSDKDTYHGLPLPFISAIDAKFASKLASYGIDFSNLSTVAEQVAIAKLINFLIAMYHLSFFDNSLPIELYKVKTKKIICYSNVIASSINIAEVVRLKSYCLADIGGIANTIYELVTSIKFRKKVKRDFVLGTYNKALSQL